MAPHTHLVCALFIILSIAPAGAQDLPFPKTEKDIIDALTLKDGATVYNGIEYLSDKGRVYKIIDGKRFRLRGLAGIVDSAIVPRAGAMIRFDHDSCEIHPESHSLLDAFGKALQSGLSGAMLMVAGHTDGTGSVDYNQALSECRAMAVAGYLNGRHAISEHRLIVRGFGELQPIADNTTDAGRALNRRVEFIRLE